MTDETRTIFEIPEANYDKFTAQLAKLSKRAEKLTGEAITPMVFGYDMKAFRGKGQIKVWQVYINVDMPKIDGWNFIATIDHSQEIGNLIRAVPNTGVEVPASYRDAKPCCDHCKVMRYRRDTYLVHKAETGEFKQVGRTCLEDFFGHDPSKVAKLAEFLGYAAEIARGYRDAETTTRDRRYYSLDSVLADAALIIRERGWVSARMAREDETLTATRDLVMSYPVNPTEDDFAMAEAAKEWARGFCENDNLNDYQHNICVVARSEMIENRAVGLAASIIAAYQREIEKSKPRQSGQIDNMKGILDLFDIAGSKLKNPAIVLDTTDSKGNTTHVRLSKAGKQAKFPGSINLTTEGSFENRDWFGRIQKDGSFDMRSNAPTGLTATLLAFASDPAAVAAEHGRRTGNCCFCNKKLKDARSIEVGYGKTCAENWGGLPWGKTPDGEPAKKATRAPQERVEAAQQAETAKARVAVPEASLPREIGVVKLVDRQADRALIESALQSLGGEVLAAWQRLQEAA